MAALAATHATDMTRKLEGTKLNAARLLYNITSAKQMARSLNNLRYRQVLPAVVREMNTWLREVQAMHRSTLQLKLNIQSLAKRLAHQATLHSPTASQMSQMHLGRKVRNYTLCVSHHDLQSFR